MLLEKREETSISLAVTVANAKIIAFYVSDTPVKPKKRYWVICNYCCLWPSNSINYILEYLDTKVHSRKDIEETVNIPIIGDIPFSEEDSQLVIELNKRSNLAEAFRLIRTNLDFMLNPTQSELGNVVGVTSTIPGEGKSYISLNLACTLALSGKKVLLVGMDLRKPKLLDYFKIQAHNKGVTHFLSDNSVSVSDLIFPAPNNIENLDIIESGLIAPNPAELLQILD